MRWILLLGSVLVVIASNSRALGHGIPITVTVDPSKKLVAENDQPLYSPPQLTPGYASMILVDDEDAAVMDHIIVNSAPLGLSGPCAFTTLPGFNVTGMAPDSGLYLQVISRPVMGTNPVGARLLWHWSLAASQDPQHPNPVTVDTNGESLTIASAPAGVVQKTTVPQAAGNPLTIKVAEPTANELGTHQHYLEYLLGDSPAADVGAYGFFARLTSPNYTPSDPFLVILNNGLYDNENPGSLLTAALAINNAALLPGDYNHDDVVNAADFALWKTNFGSTTLLAADGNHNGTADAADYTIWRDHLGQQFTGSRTSAASSNAVPEPPSFALAVVALSVLLIKILGHLVDLEIDVGRLTNHLQGTQFAPLPPSSICRPDLLPTEVFHVDRRIPRLRRSVYRMCGSLRALCGGLSRRGGRQTNGGLHPLGS
jgi:hypothetical protein